MKNPGDERFVLAGDIGGTKTNVGLFGKGKKRPVARVVETYPSGEAPNLEDIVERFLEKRKVSVSSACFGIAGPVMDGRCKTTNLPWEVSELRMKKRFNWSHARLINDLTATALAVPLLTSRELFSLNKGKSQKGGNIAIVAPGTGLGEALLIYWNGEYVPVASEGGHVDFAPNTEQEAELWHYLRERFGHVSVERVLSGPGLVDIYSWLRESDRYQEPEWLPQQMIEADPAKVITDAALDAKHPMCVESLNTFVSILGAVAGNLALTAMTTGGVYLGGGIPPKILPKLKESIFMQAFTAKGRFAGLLEGMPVRVILNDQAALLGAAHCAFQKG
ncbi:MAG: glucokinase [Deltaproteobacteria bacterium]|nr:MAG: glucokinase [Deltaproteobacteria bacterium]